MSILKDRKLTDRQMATLCDRYAPLAMLRDDDGASLGEKQNAQDAIDRLCSKHHVTEKEVVEFIDKRGIISEFYMGHDEPHIMQFKTALLAGVADGHLLKIAQFQQGKAFLLVGPRSMTEQATDLFRFLVTEIERQAEFHFENREIKFGEGQESKKLGWLQYFRLGTVLTINERLRARSLNQLREAAKANSITEELEQQKQRENIEKMFEELSKSPKMKEMMEKMQDQMKEEQAKKEQANIDRMQELGIEYNAIGFAVGQAIGKVLPLQGEVKGG